MARAPIRSPIRPRSAIGAPIALRGRMGARIGGRAIVVLGLLQAARGELHLLEDLGATVGVVPSLVAEGPFWVRPPREVTVGVDPPGSGHRVVTDGRGP